MLVTFNAVLILINFMVKCNCAKDLWYTLKKAGRIQGTTLSNISIATLVTCFNACAKNLKCKSVNYSTVKRTCETMATSVLEAEIISADGWQYHGNYLRDRTLVMFRDMFFFLFCFSVDHENTYWELLFRKCFKHSYSFNCCHIFKNVFSTKFILCEVARALRCIVLS